MKHLYLSEDGKQYNTEEEALKADEVFKSNKLKAELEEKNKKAEISKKKKELSDAINEAQNKVSIAEDEYKQAKDEASLIIKEANKKAEDIIKKALLKVDSAREEKMNAIKAFNDSFGVYTTTYTGRQAVEEYNKFTKEMNRVLNSFFDIWL